MSVVIAEMSGKVDMIDFELYGGRRAYLAHIQARVAHSLGKYGRAGHIEWASVHRLVFVCKGNICRSAYAAARAASLGMRAASFGLDASDGAPANPEAARNASQRGLDLSGHRSVRLERPLIDVHDLVLVFEPGQLVAVQERCADHVRLLSLLGVWASPSRPHIHDPYGRSDRYFQRCFTIIDANITMLSPRVPRAHLSPSQ